MASPNQGKSKKVVKKVNFAPVHRLFAGVSMIGFFVVAAGGVMANLDMMTIVFRAFVVMLAVKLVSWVVIRVLASYEEINSGKA